MLQFFHHGAPEPCARAAEHFIRNAWINDVRGDILQQYCRQHDWIDNDLVNDRVRFRHARKVDYVRRDDRHDPDGQIFEDKCKQAQYETARIVF